jgi:hypothetical protein
MQRLVELESATRCEACTGGKNGALPNKVREDCRPCGMKTRARIDDVARGAAANAFELAWLHSQLSALRYSGVSDKQLDKGPGVNDLRLI